jgi:uncharacterized protein YcfJ|tara:strand:- start:528 stop:971 length:444 start_codon:yes stop_codon:yes gene_type:complete
VKKLLTIATMATMMFAGVASAGTVRVNGEVIDHFKTVIDREPYKVEVCEKVSNKTPGSATTGDLLTGAIIGGIIGKAITNKDDGAAAGAVLGTIITNENKRENGSTTTTHDRCFWETRYKESQRTTYSHSTFTFEFEGKLHTVQFVK